MIFFSKNHQLKQINIMNNKFTEKFQKELNKFNKWAKKNYTILDKDNEKNIEVEWENISIPEYQEPPRNKLELYIKETIKLYKIKSNDTNNEIENYKTIVLNFKNEKSTKKRIKTDKKEKTEIKNKDKELKHPTLDSNIDSTDFYWHDNLDVKTTDLIQTFGEPEYTWNEESDHIWEWKIILNDKKYSIYDLETEFLKNKLEHTFENMQNVKWNIAGELKKKSIRDIKNINKYIENTNKKLSNKITNSIETNVKNEREIIKIKKEKANKKSRNDKDTNKENTLKKQKNTKEKQNTIESQNENKDELELEDKEKLQEQDQEFQDQEQEEFQEQENFSEDETDQIFSDSNDEDVDEIVSNIKDCKLGIKPIDLNDITFDDIIF